MDLRRPSTYIRLQLERNAIANTRLEFAVTVLANWSKIYGIIISLMNLVNQFASSAEVAEAPTTNMVAGSVKAIPPSWHPL